jgi:hypothetical protein
VNLEQLREAIRAGTERMSTLPVDVEAMLLQDWPEARAAASTCDDALVCPVCTCLLIPEAREHHTKWHVANAASDAALAGLIGTIVDQLFNAQEGVDELRADTGVILAEMTATLASLAAYVRQHSPG